MWQRIRSGCPYRSAKVAREVRLGSGTPQIRRNRLLRYRPVDSVLRVSVGIIVEIHPFYDSRGQGKANLTITAAAPLELSQVKQREPKCPA
jgi:hypothetical protein